MRIGIDVFGGDYAPHNPLRGVSLVLDELPEDVELWLIGRPAEIEQVAREIGLSLNGSVHLLPASEVIEMDENPARSIVQKPNSSISVGIQALKDGEIDAFISAGNTGAIVAASVLKLGNLPGVSRPTLGALYPYGENEYSLICDVGANVDCKPEHLVQFAQLGTVYMREVMNIPNPRVALLNIGEEPSKGNLLAQQTYALLQQHPSINFVGNAEGRVLNTGFADVYVTDGFVGNILLKFGEALYELLREKVPPNPILERLNYENIGGLPFIGAQGNVIIGHGISSPKAFRNMIRIAISIVEARLTEKIASAFHLHA
ncbi:MAG: phosphate acyltransferase PlsX [Bacteroidia bacterium]|nr:phosphate acyltransferase PlsX [Bacteroidia bacterium]MCX7764520.1 phosphate acyltransferase PlsX [Bacteroidia bacterium]MDW8057987.1 phosphate acyltransferase PlsX [Bacteroidia bacterium]